MKKQQQCAVTLIAVLLLAGWGCQSGTKKLATASDAISHALVNADTAATQAVASGVVSETDRQSFHDQLAKVAQAGLILDKGIRQNESASDISAKVSSFLAAFNSLNTSGLAFIKDPNTKLAISTILTGAEASVAVIAASVGK